MTADFLLKGAVYALEQCGLLLHDAARLYEHGSFATAVAVGGFAREELGRHRLLRDKWQKLVQRRKSVTLKQIQGACADHVKKQEWGQIATVLRGSLNDRIGKLIRAAFEHEPGSREHLEAEQQLKQIREAKRRRTPKDRHEQRMTALYVGPNDSGTNWKRPRDLGEQIAMHSVSDLANDYSAVLSHLKPGIIELEPPLLDAEELLFARAMLAWTERPNLLRPTWPHRGGSHGTTR